MFKAGEKVRLVRHDYFPALVGMVGIVGRSGREDPRGVEPVLASGGKNETVYQVISGTRILHDIPEAWLQRLGRR